MALTVAQYGTLQVSDLLRVNNTAIIDFGVMDVYEAVRLYLQAYNFLVEDEMQFFVERTTERVRGVGGPAAMVAHYTDEFGVDDAQKIGGPSILGFPLRQSDVTRQWTYAWLMQHTPADLAAQLQGALIADRNKVQSAIRTAIFKPTNANFTDALRDNMTIPVKAFANADGFPIPPSPTGSTFNASTHTHYMGTTGGSAGSQLAAADVDNLLLNVTEHYNGGRLVLFVSKDVEAFMTAGRYAATPTFPLYAPMLYTRQTLPNNAVFTEGYLAESQGSNRLTGTYRDAEVWVKPWMPAGTLFAFMTDAVKPLAMRVPDGVGAGNGDFGIVYQDAQIPLQCEIMRRMFGFGVQDRICGAAMTVGSTTYSQPSNL